jgi:hypothetical protein
MAEPVTPEAPTEAAPVDRNRRALIVLGAVFAAALLFFLVLKPIFFGGGGNDNESSLPPPSSGTSPPATTTTTARPAPEETFEVFGSKNPFQPPNAVPGTTPTDGSGGTTATTAPGGTGGTTETTVPDGGTGGGGASGAGTEPRASQRVALLDVYQQNGATVADVRVNSTVYTQLAPGEEFAGSYQVVSLQGTCGSFLFGDERFRLCKGEEVLK